LGENPLAFAGKPGVEFYASVLGSVTHSQAIENKIRMADAVQAGCGSVRAYGFMRDRATVRPSPRLW
jgi:hypothetical protein